MGDFLENIYTEYVLFTESRREAKQMVQSGKISQEVFDKIVSIDPTQQKKYTGWLARIYASEEQQDFDALRNTIEEFDTLVKSGLVGKDKRDIQRYKTFESLYSVVNEINNSGEAPTQSRSKLTGDFDEIVNNEDIRIVVPYTHEASRKLGLTPIERGGFAFRDCRDGKKDSAWCTTYSTNAHFDSYYHRGNVTFFYILVKGDRLKSVLSKSGFKNPKYYVVAIARIPAGEGGYDDQAVAKPGSDGITYLYDGYDGLDGRFTPSELEKWMSIVGLS